MIPNNVHVWTDLPRTIMSTERKISQTEYIQILCDDLGYNIKVRNLFLSDLVGREVKYTDDLAPKEKSRAIAELKSRKHAGRPPRRDRDDSYAERGIVENEDRRPD